VKYENLIAIISRVLNYDKKKLTHDSSMTNISEWDSIGHLNLIIELEEETKLRFTPEQISKMVDVKSIIEEIGEG